MVEISEFGKKLDVRGMFCPEPMFKTNIELQKMQVGEILTVLTDDPAAEDDITEFCSNRGHELLEMKKNGKDLEFTIKKVK